MSWSLVTNTAVSAPHASVVFAQRGDRIQTRDRRRRRAPILLSYCLAWLAQSNVAGPQTSIQTVGLHFDVMVFVATVFESEIAGADSTCNCRLVISRQRRIPRFDVLRRW